MSPLLIVLALASLAIGLLLVFRAPAPPRAV
jgi:hypothetical protein